MGALCLGLFALGFSGCAERVVVDPSELYRVESLPNGLGALRVYTSKSIVLLYPAHATRQNYDVNRTIRDRSASSSVEVIVDRDTPGQVVAEDEANGRRRLWVTFDPRCAEVDCAFGFVLTEDGAFSLSEIPQRQGFAFPSLYAEQVKAKNRFESGRRRSLAEANPVWILRRDKKLETVVLEAKKKVDRGHQRSSERVRGIE